MESEFLKWIASNGIGVGAAIAMFWIYRKDVHQALNSWRDQTLILTTLVSTVTAAITTNTAAIQSMERTLPHACPMSDQLAEGAVEIVARKLGTAR